MTATVLRRPKLYVFDQAQFVGDFLEDLKESTPSHAATSLLAPPPLGCRGVAFFVLATTGICVGRKRGSKS